MGSGVGRKRKEEMKHEGDGRKWREKRRVKRKR
jgi:hypothetical protein